MVGAGAVVEVVAGEGVGASGEGENHLTVVDKSMPGLLEIFCDFF